MVQAEKDVFSNFKEQKPLVFHSTPGGNAVRLSPGMAQLGCSPPMSSACDPFTQKADSEDSHCQGWTVL